MYSQFSQYGRAFLKIINTFHGVDNLTVHGCQHLQCPKNNIKSQKLGKKMEINGRLKDQKTEKKMMNE